MDYESLTEIQIADLVSKGDQKAFYTLYKIHSKKIFNFLYKYTNDYESAQDIMQNVFVKVYKNIGAFKFQSKLSTWITRIAFNEAINYNKKNIRSKDISIEEMPVEPADETHTDETAYSKEIVDKLKYLIPKLPPRQRTALLLAKYDNKSSEEISQIMNVSKRSAESLVFRAVEYLRASMVKNENI